MSNCRWSYDIIQLILQALLSHSVSTSASDPLLVAHHGKIRNSEDDPERNCLGLGDPDDEADTHGPESDGCGLCSGGGDGGEDSVNASYLLNLALTCHAFFEPVMDHLWADRSLIHLIKVMPPHLVTQQTIPSDGSIWWKMYGDIEPGDLLGDRFRFSSYSKRIRHLEMDHTRTNRLLGNSWRRRDKACHLIRELTEALFELFWEYPDTVDRLMPKLRTITLVTRFISHLKLSPTLLSRLSRLELTGSGTWTNEDTRRILALLGNTATLQEVRVTGRVEKHIAKFPVSDIISLLPSLRVLEFDDGLPMTHKHLGTIAISPNLESLRLRLRGQVSTISGTCPAILSKLRMLSVTLDDIALSTLLCQLLVNAPLEALEVVLRPQPPQRSLTAWFRHLGVLSKTLTTLSIHVETPRGPFNTTFFTLDVIRPLLQLRKLRKLTLCLPAPSRLTNESLEEIARSFTDLEWLEISLPGVVGPLYGSVTLDGLASVARTCPKLAYVLVALKMDGLCTMSMRCVNGQCLRSHLELIVHDAWGSRQIASLRRLIGCMHKNLAEVRLHGSTEFTEHQATVSEGDFVEIIAQRLGLPRYVRVRYTRIA
ncbi:hypothetical protein OE88DRAFT_523089 [Heliocybe sulcata]|uniref:F-box domain-containing protein n=1 Tax=Heliocybe sulcata TaxID=5364 RepID=A0A5C3MTL7_9AGAM|nr:hypothetical protein OE88DRAFT_523089 [Heliocybe sulcata]